MQSFSSVFSSYILTLNAHRYGPDNDNRDALSSCGRKTSVEHDADPRCLYSNVALVAVLTHSLYLHVLDPARPADDMLSRVDDMQCLHVAPVATLGRLW